MPKPLSKEDSQAFGETREGVQQARADLLKKHAGGNRL